MNLQEIFATAGAVVVSLGGGGAIVVGISSWLGKVWANRILENQKAEHQKEIEGYKSELQKELERLNAIQDKALYISKVQYDNEYRIYQEIWQKLHKCTVASVRLYPGYEEMPIDKEEREKYQEEKYRNFVDHYNGFTAAIEEYAPFYRDDFYTAFAELRQACHEMGDIFKQEEFDKKYNATFAALRDEPMSIEDRRRTMELRKEISTKKEQLAKEIREYLRSLQLRE